MIRHGLGIQGRREQAAALHHASRALSPPRPRLIQKASEAETKAIGMVSLYVCIPVHFSAFFLKNFLLIPLYLFYLFFIKKWKSRQKHCKPLCRNDFRVSTFLLPRHLFVGRSYPCEHSTAAL